MPLLYTFVLSQVFGLFILILVILMVSKRQFYVDMLKNLKPESPVIFLGAALGLVVGILLVETHNVWELNYRIFVTLYAWVTFVLSVFWLAIPKEMLALTKRLFVGKTFYWFIFILALVSCTTLGRGTMVFITHHLYTGRL